MVEII